MRTQRRAVSRRVRFAVLAAGGFRCRYCGAKPPRAYLQVDHVVPVASGGTNDAGNLAPACVECNGGKSDAPLPGPVTWNPVIREDAGCRHPGPWVEHPYGAPGSPGDEIALVCDACRYIVAVREWVA